MYLLQIYETMKEQVQTMARLTCFWASGSVFAGGLSFLWIWLHTLNVSFNIFVREMGLGMVVLLCRLITLFEHLICSYFIWNLPNLSKVTNLKQKKQILIMQDAIDIQEK